MNLQAELSRYLADGDVAHLHEALVVAESISGVIVEQIERALRTY